MTAYLMKPVNRRAVVKAGLSSAAMIGTPSVHANALAALTPTNNAPISPG